MRRSAAGESPGGRAVLDAHRGTGGIPGGGVFFSMGCSSNSMARRDPSSGNHLRMPGETAFRLMTGRFLQRLRMAAVMADPAESIQVIDADPDDNRVLECTVSAGASYVISGDDHLLSVGSCRGIPILSPAAFLKLLETAGGEAEI
jgi:hypothetical protein